MILCLFTGCGEKKYSRRTIIKEPIYDYFISLPVGDLTLGSSISDTSLFDYDSEEDIYIQKLGLYDFQINQENQVIAFKSGSKDVLISDKIHVGMTQAEINSYIPFILIDKVGKYQFSYLDSEHNVVITILYDSDFISKIIQIETVQLKGVE